jgi:hypothetical protein
LIQFKNLLAAMDSVKEALTQNREESHHLGYNVFLSVREENPCVDIRQYWKPTEDSEVVPTRRGLCLRPSEFQSFSDLLGHIENSLPELVDVERCDHQNQMGMFECNICNPDEYKQYL